jgi:hypothetical protein
MSYRLGVYSIEELIALRESPLVTKPDLPPQMEQWINQPANERRNLQNSQSQYSSLLIIVNLTLRVGVIQKMSQNTEPQIHGGHVRPPRFPSKTNIM